MARWKVLAISDDILRVVDLEDDEDVRTFHTSDVEVVVAGDLLRVDDGSLFDAYDDFDEDDEDDEDIEPDDDDEDFVDNDDEDNE